MKKIILQSWGVPDVSSSLVQRIEKSAQILHDGTGEGSAYLGWLDLPENYDKKEYARIAEVAAKIRADADVFITIGIGGSYLGTRALVHGLTSRFVGDYCCETGEVDMLYAGHHLSSEYMSTLFTLIKEKSVYINVISKSGTTLEPALAFRLLREMLEDRYGADGAAQRIFVTTDKERGALVELAKEKDYETFIVPDDIGGRYSVLSAVGLLPLAVSGVDIDALMDGARSGRELYSAPYEDNPCYQYAALRQALYEDGKKIEVLVAYEPAMQYFAQWWQQLFGESEGKQSKGLYPSVMQFTTDLHSLGQYVQDGQKILFETVVDFTDPGSDILIKHEIENYDGLNYLAGKTLHDANTAARRGTRAAHLQGGVPQIELTIPLKDAYCLGQLLYFFEKACAVSAYTMGVNPFDQPGVEAYKKEMFRLLGKP